MSAVTTWWVVSYISSHFFASLISWKTFTFGVFIFVIIWYMLAIPWIIVFGTTMASLYPFNFSAYVSSIPTNYFIPACVTSNWFTCLMSDNSFMPWVKSGSWFNLSLSWTRSSSVSFPEPVVWITPSDLLILYCIGILPPPKAKAYAREKWLVFGSLPKT